MSISDEALKLANLGWPIVLLHSHHNGVCTCRKGNACPEPGKHPRLEGWPSEATSDEDTLCGLFQRFPESNIGLRLGQLIDVEYDSPEGEATADAIFGDCFTPTWQSSKGELHGTKLRALGKHRLFLPPGIPETKLDYHGLEIRLAGNAKALQSVIPPSRHATGVTLQWLPGLSPFDVEPQPLPQALLEAIQPQPSGNGELCFEVEDSDFCTAAGVGAGQRQPKLMRMALAWFVEHGNTPELVQQRLIPEALAWNQRNTPPHEPGYIQVEVLKLRDWDAQRNGIRQPAATTHTQPQVVAVPPPKPRQLKYQPFPTQVLPEPLGSFVKAAAKSIGCDESFVALPALATCASLIGNAVRVELKTGWQEPILLWLGVIARPGAKKTPAQAAATEPLLVMQDELRKAYQAERQGFEQQQLQYEMQLKAWKQRAAKQATSEPPPLMTDEPPEPRLWLDDVTAEGLARVHQDNPRGLLLWRDELTAFIRSMNEYKGKGSDLQRWLKVFNATAIVVDRTSRDTIYLPRPNVSISGGVQPKLLYSFLSGETVDAGLMQRFCFAAPPHRTARLTRQGISQATRAEYAQLLRRLYALPLDDEPAAVAVTDDAWELFSDFDNHMQTQSAEHEGILAEAANKLPAVAARLAGILHCIRETTHPRLTHESMRLGVTLAAWFWDEWQRVFELCGETPEARGNRELAEYIQSHGGQITPYELARNKRAIADTSAAEFRLAQLQAAGWGSFQVLDSTGGRPSRVFQLH